MTRCTMKVEEKTKINKQSVLLICTMKLEDVQ